MMDDNIDLIYRLNETENFLAKRYLSFIKKLLFYKKTTITLSNGGSLRPFNPVPLWKTTSSIIHNAIIFNRNDGIYSGCVTPHKMMSRAHRDYQKIIRKDQDYYVKNGIVRHKNDKKTQVKDLSLVLIEYMKYNHGIKTAKQNNIFIHNGSYALINAIVKTVSEKGDIILSAQGDYFGYGKIAIANQVMYERIPANKNNGFKLTSTNLASWFRRHAKKAHRVKAIIINNPSSNGIVYSLEELKRLSRAILKLRFLGYKFCVISDELFQHTEVNVALEGAIKLVKTKCISETEEMGQFTFVTGSLSKVFGAARKQFGYCYVPNDMVGSFNKILHSSLPMLVPFNKQLFAARYLDYLANFGDNIITCVYLLENAIELYKRRALISELVKKLNQQLEEKLCLKINYVNLPIFCNAGMAIMIDFSDFIRAVKKIYGFDYVVTQENSPVCNSLDFACFLYNKAKVMVSPMYSCGVDEPIVLIKYAEIGYTVTAKVMEKELCHRLKSASNLSTDKDTNSCYAQAFLYGRKKIAEAFNRIEVALLELFQCQPEYHKRG